MTIFSIPTVAPSKIPLLILLTVAGAACMLLIGELRGRLAVIAQNRAKQATPRERAQASLGIFLIIAVTSAALFLIGGLIGFGFSPSWFIICTALALLTIYGGLSNPAMARCVENLSTARLALRVTALVMTCLALALFFDWLAGRQPLPL